jgi:hypothetical protein
MNIDTNMLQGKWQSFHQLFQKLKKGCMFGQVGKPVAWGDHCCHTEAAYHWAVGYNAAKKSPISSEFHAAFEEVQHLRDDTCEETISPYKKVSGDV